MANSKRSNNSSAIAVPDRKSRLSALSPEKQALIRALRAGRRPTGHGTVVSLRPGTDPQAGAVVLCHPIGGGVFCYTELAALLAGPHAVLGIAAGESGRETVAALADEYLALLAADGHRPAVLAGWSFGGLLAYEMARRLAADMPVVLLDSMSWPRSVPAWDAPTTLRTFMEDVLGGIGLPTEPLPVDPTCWRLPPAQAFEVAVDQLRAHGLNLDLEPADLVPRHRGYAAATRAMQAYQPGSYSGPVTLLHAEDSAVEPAEWRDRAAELHVYPVAGGHYDVVRSPIVERAADLIRTAIRHEQRDFPR